MNPERRPRRGYSLLELIVTVSLFGLLSALGFLILRNSGKVFATASGRDRATAQLIKAEQALRRDLEMGRPGPASMTVTTAPASLGGGADSDAICFLSAQDPVTGETQTHLDGSPFWMRNILYYATVPTDYASSIGGAMTGGNVGGYDYSCPAKQLVRVEIDQNTGNNPTVDTTEDQLVTALAPFLTRPTGVFRSATRKTVATQLLMFRCQPLGAEIRIDLRAVSLDDARRDRGFGATVPYETGKYTIQHSLSIFPKN